MSCFSDSLIVNTKSNIKAVLTPLGAVYDNFKTSDTRNLTRAFAALFDGNWRYATGLETREMQALEARGEPALNLVWDRDNTAKVANTAKVHLRLVVNNG